MDHSLELKDLLSRIRQGDDAAYETIFNRYRAAAMSWAQSIVRDPYLADDIVQEAFIRMKEKLHQLKDEQKFAAWFRLMIRRMAINSIRGGESRRTIAIEEMPDPGPANRGSLDEIRQWHEQEASTELVRRSLAKLSKQARDVLYNAAHEEATPEQLAERYNIKKSNVYNILSRARLKVNDERFREEVAAYVLKREMHDHPSACMLPAPTYPKPYAFISAMIGEALGTADIVNFTYTELMGISAEAFRMNMPENCNWQGILTFDWSYAAYRTVERLGVSGVCVGRPQQTMMTPDIQLRMLSVIHGSVDRGIPAVIWNLEQNEMGFAHGYNDRSQEIHYKGYNGETRIYRYEQLGRQAGDRPVFVFGLRRRVSPPASENTVLRAIVEHARGKEPPLKGYAFGLDGYRLWLAGARGRTLDLSGHAYQVAILAEAREQAAAFLERLADRSPGADRSRQLLAAANCYKQVSKWFVQLYPRFPFGYGGSPANRWQDIQEGLQGARAAEEEGIARMEAILADS
ncbi:RNA polymerase sigma factor [Paenibacillus sp. 1P07SE]|uniref:RNA polymerase sigma factor n=1 Tax=Paenibacillus sp. 1P07SE TaxID=3132209 RepID=UPI0039A4AC5F